MERQVAATLLCVFAVACGGETGPGSDVEVVQVTPNPIALAQQASVQLQVATLDGEGVLIVGVPVTFAPANPNLISVSNTGLVESLGPAGNTSVTVAAGGRSVQVPVTITPTGNTLRLLPSPAIVPQLGTLQLDAALLDLVGTPIPGATFTFLSSAPSVATVSQSGLVTSIGPAGSGTISASSGGVTVQVQLDVTQVPTSIETPVSIKMGRNSTTPVSAQVLDAVGTPIPGLAVNFVAEPISLLSITTSGSLTAAAGVGTGSVTVSSGTVSATVPVSVVDIGGLAGSLITQAMTQGSPFGVALGSGSAYLGVGTEGFLYQGSFGSPAVQANLSAPTSMLSVMRDPGSGLLYAPGSQGEALMEIDPATRMITRTWAANDQMFDVVLSPDATHLFVAGSSGIVYMIELASFTSVDEFVTGESVIHLLAHPSDPIVYASGVGFVREINVQSGAQRTFVLDDAQATALALAGDRLFVAGEGGNLGVVTLSTGATSSTAVPCAMYDVVTLPEGRGLLGTCSLQGKVVLLDTETLTVVVSVQTGGAPRRAVVSADGESAIVANQSGWFDHIQ